ncbi:MAG: hypothetical protein RIT45_1864 [Pseudomonadota bacterium]
MSAIRLAIFVWMLLLATTAHAELRALRSSKAAPDGLRWVVVAEGYRDAEREVFFADAGLLVDALFVDATYAFLSPHIEVHGLFVASKEAGADHPSKGIYVDTAFDGHYEAFGVDRLLVVANSKVLAAVGAAVPSYDLAIVLVNDGAYGGSGGPVPVASKHIDSPAILRHELGHTVAGLADTYETPYPGYPPGDDEPNVCSAEHLGALPWAVWVEAGTPIPTDVALATGPYHPIGAYEGARYLKTGMYRPAPTCLMRDLESDWCDVCREAMVRSVLSETFAIRAASPAQTSPVVCAASGCPPFAVDITPHPAATVQWLLNDILVGSGTTLAIGHTASKPATLRAVASIESKMLSAPAEASLRRERSWTLVAAGETDVGATPDHDAVDSSWPTLDGGNTNDAGAQPTPRTPAPGCSARAVPPTPPQTWLVLVAAVAVALHTRRRRYG